jgi:hypothetical protein
MSKTRFTGNYVNGKKVMELEITQEDCDEMNELRERLFGHLSDDVKKAMRIPIEKDKPHKKEFLFG